VALCSDKKEMNISGLLATRIMLLCYIMLVSYLYLDYFHIYLYNGDWLDLENGYTRIIVPDTFIYNNIVDVDNAWFSIISSGVKNTIGPSLIWFFGQFDWFVVLGINIFFIWFIFVFFERNLRFYAVEKVQIQRAMVLLALLPSMWFYTIGALKELPMMLFLLMFVHYFNQKKWIGFFLTLVALVVFRYQLMVILLTTFACIKVTSRSFRFSLLGIIVLSLVYPSITSLGPVEMEAVERFRSFQENSIGGFVENIRNSYYGASLFAIIIRVVQSLFEPFLTFIMSPGNYFYEDGWFSVYRFIQFSTLAMVVPYIYRALLNMIGIYKIGKFCNMNIQFIYVMLVLSVVMVGGFSFIHHRYLFPFFPLIMIAAIIHPRKYLVLRSRIVSSG